MVQITGSQIHLKSIHHSFAGSIKDRIVSGYKKAGRFESELTILENDRKYTASFKRSEHHHLSGQFLTIKDSEEQLHRIELLGLDRDTNTFTFRFGEKNYGIKVQAEDFQNGHFINPEYSMDFEGERVSFKLEGGQACYGYSAHLIAMIFPTYIF